MPDRENQADFEDLVATTSPKAPGPQKCSILTLPVLVICMSHVIFSFVVVSACLSRACYRFVCSDSQ